MMQERFGNPGAAVFLAVLGAVLILTPGTAVSTLVRCFGLVLILIGTLKLVPQLRSKMRDAAGNAALVSAAVTVAAGFLVMMCPEKAASVFPLFAGAVILLVGIVHLLHALAAKQAGDSSARMMLVFSVITIACGAMICCNPFSAVTTLVRIIGVIFVYNGITGFWIEAKKI